MCATRQQNCASAHSHPVILKPFISGGSHIKYFLIFNNQVAITTPVTLSTPHISFYCHNRNYHLKEFSPPSFLRVTSHSTIHFLCFSFHVGIRGFLLILHDEWTSQVSAQPTKAISRVFTIICVCVYSRIRL